MKQTRRIKDHQSIKTIKSHDSILVPLLGRGVFTAGFAPPRQEHLSSINPPERYYCKTALFYTPSIALGVNLLYILR